MHNLLRIDEMVDCIWGVVIIWLLRGDGHRFKGIAEWEGMARYRHQRSGQVHTHQIKVNYS